MVCSVQCAVCIPFDLILFRLQSLLPVLHISYCLCKFISKPIIKSHLNRRSIKIGVHDGVRADENGDANDRSVSDLTIIRCSDDSMTKIPFDQTN